MIISDSARFVFIHNPKVGGMTFRTALAPYDTRDNKFFEWQRVPGSKVQIDMAHITLFQLQLLFPKVLDEVATYFKFGFVRDPYTRFLSAVAQHLKLGTAYTSTAIFREPDLFYRIANNFALTVLRDTAIEADFKLAHFRRQSNFFYLGGARWADLILKLEDPAALAANRAAAWLVPGSDVMTPRNLTRFSDQGYDVAAQPQPAIAAVTRFYERDFERFGYPTR